MVRAVALATHAGLWVSFACKIAVKERYDDPFIIHVQAITPAARIWKLLAGALQNSATVLAADSALGTSSTCWRS
jgi:hypothetical protein